MISTHILDTSTGTPAAGVTVILEILSQNNWQKVHQGKTNNDGRFSFECPQNCGHYRIIFYTHEYFKNKNIESFFLATPVSFVITEANRKYHIPLLVNPFGYTTYRGS